MAKAGKEVASAVSQAVADEIAAWRGRLHLTMADVYRQAGIPKTSYDRYEKGQREFNVEHLAAICAVLDITVSELVAEAERHRPEAFGVKRVTNVKRGRRRETQ